MTATPAVAQLLYLLDQAFEGTEWHSLLGNLQSLQAEDWLWVPPGGHRSIRYHAGEINHLRSLRQQTDRWEYDAQ